MESARYTDEDVRPRFGADTSRSTSYGVFSGSQHFTVTGGTFSNVTNTYPTASAVPSDFRVVPFGDIDLQREIRLESHSGVVDRQPDPRTVRRVYSAKIDRGRSTVTVVTYQGADAEEEWRRDVAKYMALRHPNIIQICGTAKFGNIHAGIFHEGATFQQGNTMRPSLVFDAELIPMRDFLGLYRDSHFASVFIYDYCDAEFQGARNYFYSTFRRVLFDSDCTPFIRPSSGRFCVDLRPGNMVLSNYRVAEMSDTQGLELLSAPNMDAAVIESLTLEQYHGICYWKFATSHHHYTFAYSTATWNLGAVTFCTSENELGDLVACLPILQHDLNLPGWVASANQLGDVTADGWTRFRIGNVADGIAYLNFQYIRPSSWFSQANSVFCRLGILSNFQDHVLWDDLYFYIQISGGSVDSTDGFLFLAPPKEFRNSSLSFNWPDCPAYWSLDPSGADRLSMADARAAELGFPSLRFFVHIGGRSWDTGVYAGLRQFYQVQGFDPDSEDVAWHLECPFYELSNDIVDVRDKVFDAASSNDMPESNGGDEEFGLPAVREEFSMSPYILYIQLTLISFLTLSWLYNQIVM